MTGERNIETLKSQMNGAVLTPDDAEYDEARRIWNGMIDKRPAAIARCLGEADVAAAVSLAREHGLPLAIRGGGHNIAGNALCDDGLVIDLSRMKSVRVDPERRRAVVEAGCLLSDVDRECQAFGLATPLGINSTTGVAGLTLGGGFGWLTRQYGMTIDNLISARVVTADGERRNAGDQEHEDLFWALRGGGGNFGVVTSFEFALHEVGPEVLAGLVVFPAEQARSVLEQYRDYIPRMPEAMNVWAVLRQAPPLPFLPEAVHGRNVLVMAVFHAGDAAAGQAAIDPIRRFGSAHGEHVGAMPYTAWQQAFDPLLTDGARNYWKSQNLTELSDGAIDAAIEHTRDLPSPQCEVFFGLIGGKAAAVPADATAYAARDTLFAMNIHGRWDDAADDERCIAWARTANDAVAPHASGSVYVNFMTAEETARVPSAYGGNHERLARIKRLYDPENLFRINQNIPPAG